MAAYIIRTIFVNKTGWARAVNCRRGDAKRHPPSAAGQGNWAQTKRGARLSAGFGNGANTGVENPEIAVSLLGFGRSKRLIALIAGSLKFRLAGFLGLLVLCFSDVYAILAPLYSWEQLVLAFPN